MRKKHTEEEIVGILHGAEASGKRVKEYCREKGWKGLIKRDTKIS